MPPRLATVATNRISGSRTSRTTSQERSCARCECAVGSHGHLVSFVDPSGLVCHRCPLSDWQVRLLRLEDSEHRVDPNLQDQGTGSWLTRYSHRRRPVRNSASIQLRSLNSDTPAAGRGTSNSPRKLCDTGSVISTSGSRPGHAQVRATTVSPVNGLEPDVSAGRFAGPTKVPRAGFGPIDLCPNQVEVAIAVRTSNRLFGRLLVRVQSGEQKPRSET